MRMQDDWSATTLTDVAREAGVSKATASKALAGRYDVSASTKARVLRVAAELSFSPNLLARGLGGGKTQTVGVITSDLEGRFAPQIVTGIEDALGADRSSVLMCNSRGNPELEAHHIREVLRRSVDGLILIGDRPEPRAALTGSGSVPVVYAVASSQDPDDTSVVCDNVEAGRLATDHLLGIGRTRVAYLGGPVLELAARDRSAGCLASLGAAGLELATPEPLFGDWSEQWGWDATARLVDEGVAFDGLVCGDDQIARGALDQVRARGASLSVEVGVIGFDNWRVLSQDSRQPFSSVDMNLGELGRAAARALTAPDGPRAGTQRISGKVVVRSTRPAR